jgi:hypothetical protein
LTTETGQAPQRPTRLGDRRFGAVLFVLTTIVLWFVFGSLSQIVITCIPGAGRCLLAEGWRTWFVGNASDAIGRRDLILILISLAIAAWAAKRMLFPPEDFDAID